jgi:PilZ domain
MSPDWLTLALGVLPAAPADLSVSRAEGGDAQVRLVGRCDRGLIVRMAAADADATSGVTFALDRPGRGTFAVFGTIRTVTPLGDGDCEVMIEVDEVLRWKQRRRVRLDLPATVTLDELRIGRRRKPAPVRVLDLSAEGVALSIAGHYRRGDRIRVSMQVGHREITVAARVLQVGRPVFGQSRISCTFLYNEEIAEAIRDRPSDGEAAA